MTVPRSSEIAVNSMAGGVQGVELGEDGVLAEAVDDQGVVAALADALVLGARLDPDVIGEDLLLALDSPSQGRDPLIARGARKHCAMLTRCVGSLTSMPEPTDSPSPDPSDSQARVVAHADGPLLVGGVAGSGRTEALALRLASLADHGERALALTCLHSTAGDLRTRAEEMASEAFEELAVHPHRVAAVRLLREHSTEAGVDPFLESFNAAERLAMLLDRVDELPLRRHEIRGNAGGLLARLIGRIDALKSAAVTPERFRAWADELTREASDDAERDSAEREREFAELYAIHDSVLFEAGATDGGSAVLELTRLLGERPALAASISERYPHLIVDELEDACEAERALIGRIAKGSRTTVLSCDDEQGRARCSSGGAAWARSALGQLAEVNLATSWRYGGSVLDAAHAVLAPTAGRDKPEGGRRAAGPETEVAFWSAANERAEAQAVAREIESALAAGEVRSGRVCVAVPPGAGRSRGIAAALEERRVPYRLSWGGAFFQRPEVRDVIAWLRLLADPTDAAAAVRALSRPPVELRSVDLARCTTIARRRKLDMISALEASLESPQIPPEARDRIRAFLNLHAAAARAMGERPTDVFVRRLIERVGFRRQRLFAAHPEAVERLRNLSRLGELAAEWTRREPNGSSRDFARYLVAVSEAGVSPEDEPAVPVADAVRVMPFDTLKGAEFDRVYVVGLQAESVPGPVPTGAPDVPMKLGGGGASHQDSQRRLLYTAMTRAAERLVLSRPIATDEGPVAASPFYEEARAVLGAEESGHEEELFGPAEGLHATYRMVQDEVLEEAWRAGGTLNEPRLDTYMDVSRAVARFLELLKLGALIQRPEEGTEPTTEALRAINDMLAQSASEQQREALQASALDDYLLDAEGEARRRSELVASRDEPSLEAFLPRRGQGLALSATDIELYRTCPLEVQVRARLRDPAGADDQPALRDRHPPGARALPRAGHLGRRRGGQPEPADGAVLSRVEEVGLRRIRRRAAVPRARGHLAAPLPRARVIERRQPEVGGAQVRLPAGPAPPARPRRPGGRAAAGRLRIDRLQDGRSEA